MSPAEGYRGPGIGIRIEHRFGSRMMEWFMAFHMIMFGGVLLMPAMTFNQPAWRTFRERGLSEDFLGWVMFAVGILHIVGLIINGARKNVTPQIRQVSAAIGCVIWAGITFGFYSPMSSRPCSPSIRCLRLASWSTSIALRKTRGK